MSVKFYELGQIKEENIQFVVMQAQYKGQWIFAKHKLRTTWEIPGGHIEQGETPMEAAKRELVEETGSIDFNEPVPLFVYGYTQEDVTTYGMMFYVEVKSLGELKHEIKELVLRDTLPEQLTYTHIQPFIFEKTIEILRAKHVIG